MDQPVPRTPAHQYRGTFDVEECEHYNMQLNGKMCMVVPGKLVVFQRPVDLPATYHWVLFL